ncbi:hypothetical protein Celaphus_00004915 [Cervus elaphus hippelaphus]|uniref:Homeobox domain-containing protein n=1 Tax=Cervus elaphus hippelaphus TaxID=46360 RepID=A0A212DDX9_CEREH|nr:hypothetical protein Celaphus_00004915 [Cervus elaphus hippelaphus]
MKLLPYTEIQTCDLESKVACLSGKLPGTLDQEEAKKQTIGLQVTNPGASSSPALLTETVATKKCRRSRTSFTEEQLKILVQAFSQNPYPGYTAKQRLAVEINTEESRIQTFSTD